MSSFKPTAEQQKILDNSARSLIVSASAGSGKTAVLVEDIAQIVCKKKVPIKKFLVLTFTNVAADEMKSRLLQTLSQAPSSKFLYEQIDDLPNSDICTIDSFCERVIKKNLDKLQLDQTFSVIDETQSLKLKRDSFDEACASFVRSRREQYWEVFNSFKRNRDAVFECLQKTDDFLGASHDAEQIVEKILNDQSQIFDHSCQNVKEFFSKQLDRIQARLEQIKPLLTSEKTQAFLLALLQIVQSLKKDMLFDMAAAAKEIELPLTPRGAEEKDIAVALSSLRAEIKDILEQLGQFSVDRQHIEKQKQGTLAIALTQLYLAFKSNYQQTKQNDSLLDFADIEKICASLLKDDQVRQNLQNAYQYVFVDEYQDTNTLQAEIIKTISRICNFVAVGDPKQAIYGFRNATMEIMKNDIAVNSSSPDGNVVYLRGNFRSDKKVLDFVNDVFAPIMTTQNTGIDYKATSMLEGKAECQEHGNVVDVFVVDKPEQEKADKMQIYSVRKDSLVASDRDILEAKCICKYIDDLLVQKIYDIKQKMWRSVELGDIVILLRGRGSLMSTIESELIKGGYPVIADNKEDICNNAQVQVLINFLKIIVGCGDDVAYSSVLLSKLGDMTIDEISQIAQNNEGQTLTDKIFSTDCEKVANLQKNIEKFKTESEIYGIRRAFELLFSRTNYFAYLKSLVEEEYHIVERFLSIISQSDNNFSPSSLLSYLQSLSSSKVSSEQPDNAIKIMTIHGSKGMEYPIAILAGCGKAISSPNRTPYILTQELGLCTYQFDQENMLRIKTPQYEASKILKKNAEYIDELMIFYVALTRAKNRLMLSGSFDLQKYSCPSDIFDAKCYFDWIFMGQNEHFIENLLNSEDVKTQSARFVKVSEVEDLKTIEKQNIFVENDEKLTKKIENYLNFQYKNINLSKQEFKNSVTGLLKLQIDDVRENMPKNDLPKGFKAKDVGTIYHVALKEIDFETINSPADVKKALARLTEQGYLLAKEAEIINIDILFNDIIILKRITSGKKVFKERAFIMKLPLSQVLGGDNDDGVLVQGVVDMFALGQENVLVDYKFTSIESPQKLLEKYKNQLLLYSKAIENAFGIKLQKKYIFSIKNGKLIEFFE